MTKALIEPRNALQAAGVHRDDAAAGWEKIFLNEIEQAEK